MCALLQAIWIIYKRISHIIMYLKRWQKWYIFHCKFQLLCNLLDVLASVYMSVCVVSFSITPLASTFFYNINNDRISDVYSPWMETDAHAHCGTCTLSWVNHTKFVILIILSVVIHVHVIVLDRRSIHIRMTVRWIDQHGLECVCALKLLWLESTL